MLIPSIPNKQQRTTTPEHVHQSNTCQLNLDPSRQPWLGSRSSERQDTHCCSRTSEGTWCWSQRNPNPAGWPYLQADELVKSVRGCCGPVHFHQRQPEQAGGIYCYGRLMRNRDAAARDWARTERHRSAKLLPLLLYVCLTHPPSLSLALSLYAGSL